MPSLWESPHGRKGFVGLGPGILQLKTFALRGVIPVAGSPITGRPTRVRIFTFGSFGPAWANTSLEKVVLILGDRGTSMSPAKGIPLVSRLCGFIQAKEYERVSLSKTITARRSGPRGTRWAREHIGNPAGVCLYGCGYHRSKPFAKETLFGAAFGWQLVLVYRQPHAQSLPRNLFNLLIGKIEMSTFGGHLYQRLRIGGLPFTIKFTTASRPPSLTTLEVSRLGKPLPPH